MPEAFLRFPRILIASKYNPWAVPRQNVVRTKKQSDSLARMFE
jgi:hypothetical protein